MRFALDEPDPNSDTRSGEHMGHHAKGLGPYVIIEHAIGTATHPRCVLDFSDDDCVLVISLDTLDTVQEYEPGRWKEAKQIDTDGHVDVHVVAMVPVSQPCTHCSRTAWFVQIHPGGSVSYQCAIGDLVVVAPIMARKSA